MQLLSNDTESYIIAISYGFSPTRQDAPTGNGTPHAGKTEPDLLPGADERTMNFANYSDNSNIGIRYEPDNLIPP